jgi:hypothetical protein
MKLEKVQGSCLSTKHSPFKKQNKYLNESEEEEFEEKNF